MLLTVYCFQFKDLNRDLYLRIRDLDDFKTVLQTISTIQSSNISTELHLHKIQEMFAILREHKVLVSVLIVQLFIVFVL